MPYIILDSPWIFIFPLKQSLNDFKKILPLFLRKNIPKLFYLFQIVFDLFKFLMDSSTSYSSTTSKPLNGKKVTHDIHEENDYLRATVEKLTIQLSNMKIESQKKNNTISEHQKWIKNLTAINSANYPQAMEKINEGIENYLFMR